MISFMSYIQYKYIQGICIYIKLQFKDFTDLFKIKLDKVLRFRTLHLHVLILEFLCADQCAILTLPSRHSGSPECFPPWWRADWEWHCTPVSILPWSPESSRTLPPPPLIARSSQRITWTRLSAAPFPAPTFVLDWLFGYRPTRLDSDHSLANPLSIVNIIYIYLYIYTIHLVPLLYVYIFT